MLLLCFVLTFLFFVFYLARPAWRCRLRAYVLLTLLFFLNVVNFIRQGVDGSQRGLLH